MTEYFDLLDHKPEQIWRKIFQSTGEEGGDGASLGAYRLPD